MKTISLLSLSRKNLLIGFTGFLLLLTLFSITSSIFAPSADAVACACNKDCQGNAPDNICSKQNCGSNKTGICQQCSNVGQIGGQCPANQKCVNNANGKNVCVVVQVTPPPPPPPVNNSCSAGTSDIMLVIDGSNSMKGEKLAGAKRAANQFINIVARNPQNRVGVATFDNNGGLKAGISRDYGNARQAINSINPPGTGDGGTCLECAIDKKGDGDVRSAFANAGGNNKKVVIILTDGRINRWMKDDGSIAGSTRPADEEQARNQALGAINGVRSTFNATFSVIQYGGTDNKAWLSNQVVHAPGTYQGEANGESLEKMYADIADEILGGSIIGYVYHDVNKNGSSDSGEPPLANVTVTLTGVGAKQTGADGKAVFPGLCPGSFSLAVTTPESYTPSPPNSTTKTVTLPPGGSVTENFGFAKEGGVTPPVTEPVTPPVTITPTEAISFLFKLALHGIGIAGDNVLPRPSQCTRNGTSAPTGCLSNQKPLHPERPFTVEVLNTLGETVATLSGKLLYSSNSGTFESNVSTTSAITTGPFSFRVHTPMFLKKKILYSGAVEPGETYQLPLTDLTASDVDNDNVLTVLDYNMIAPCYHFPKQVNPCTANEIAEVDTDDNGIIDDFNINLFTREVIVQHGD